MHDVEILVTENGLADQRGVIREQLADCFRRALVKGGHTRRLLAEVLSWLTRRKRTGTMPREKRGRPAPVPEPHAA